MITPFNRVANNLALKVKSDPKCHDNLDFLHELNPDHKVIS